MLITPTRPRSTTYEPKVADLTLLREASERVSEILRENRRRLDSGEDTNVARSKNLPHPSNARLFTHFGPL